MKRILSYGQYYSNFVIQKHLFFLFLLFNNFVWCCPITILDEESNNKCRERTWIPCKNVGREESILKKIERENKIRHFLSRSSLPFEEGSWEICEYSPISLFPLGNPLSLFFPLIFCQSWIGPNNIKKELFFFFWFWWVFLEIWIHIRKTHLVFSFIFEKKRVILLKNWKKNKNNGDFS